MSGELDIYWTVSKLYIDSWFADFVSKSYVSLMRRKFDVLECRICFKKNNHQHSGKRWET